MKVEKSTLMKQERVTVVKEIQVPSIEEIPVETFTLTLSREEAVDLWIVTGFIGGNPKGTVRESTEELYQILGARLGIDIKHLRNMQNADPFRYGVSRSMLVGSVDE